MRSFTKLPSETEATEIAGVIVKLRNFYSEFKRETTKHQARKSELKRLPEKIRRCEHAVYHAPSLEKEGKRNRVIAKKQRQHDLDTKVINNSWYVEKLEEKQKEISAVLEQILQDWTATDKQILVNFLRVPIGKTQPASVVSREYSYRIKKDYQKQFKQVATVLAENPFFSQIQAIGDVLDGKKKESALDLDEVGGDYDRMPFRRNRIAYM